MPKKPKKFKAWGVFNKDGSLATACIVEGCQNCEPGEDGYEIFYSRAAAKRMCWDSVGQYVAEVSIKIL